MTVPMWFTMLALCYLAMQVAGLVVGLVRWHHLGLPERFAALWFGVAAIAGIVEHVLRTTQHNSQLAAHLWFAPSGVLALWIAAGVVTGRRARALWRAAALAYLGVIAMVLAITETPAEYSPYAGAIHGMVLVGVGAHSIVYRAGHAGVSLWRDASFLIGAGLLLIGGPTTFLALVSRTLGSTDGATVRVLYAMRLCLAVGGQGFILRGLLPMPRRGREHTQ